MERALRRLVLAPFVIPGFALLFLSMFSLVFWMGVGSTKPEDLERRDVFKETLRGRRAEAVLGLLLGLAIGAFAFGTTAAIIASLGHLPLDRLLGCAAAVSAVALLPPAGSWLKAAVNATREANRVETPRRESLPLADFARELEEEGEGRANGRKPVR